MSLRRVQDKADSLGLLFDTICNAFGGIIVIAVLAALMSHEIKQSEDQAKAATSSKEIVERRLAHAKQDLAEAQKSLSELASRESSKDPNLKNAFEMQIDLQKQLQQLQAKVSASQSELDSIRQTDAVGDPGLKKQQMASREVQINSQLEKLQKQIDDQNLEAEDLEKQSSELVAQITAASKPNVKNLRLPKEHSTEKDPWFIIIKNGEIFSKEILDSGDVNPNRGIFNIETNGDSETWTPIPGHGISSSDQPAIVQLLSQVQQSGRYISFVVCDDSFSAFIIARDHAISQGIEYGWIPQEKDDPIIFSTTGSVPQPQ